MKKFWKETIIAWEISAFAGSDRVNNQNPQSGCQCPGWHSNCIPPRTHYVTVTQTCSFKEYIQVVKTRGKKLHQAHLMTHRILTHVRPRTEIQFHNKHYEDNQHNSEAHDMDKFFFTICISLKSFTHWL